MSAQATTSHFGFSARKLRRNRPREPGPIIPNRHRSFALSSTVAKVLSQGLVAARVVAPISPKFFRKSLLSIIKFYDLNI